MIAEPVDPFGLWQRVGPLIGGWPDSNEDLLDELATGWHQAAVDVATARDFDPAPMLGSWPDQAGQMLHDRIARMGARAGAVSDGSATLAAQSMVYATEVAWTKNAIVQGVQRYLPAYAATALLPGSLGEAERDRLAAALVAELDVAVEGSVQRVRAAGTPAGDNPLIRSAGAPPAGGDGDDSLWDAIGDVGAEIGEVVGDIGEGAAEIAGEAGEAAGEIAGEAGEAAGEVIGGATEGPGELLDEIGEGAGEIFGEAGEGAGELGDEIGEAAEDIVTDDEAPAPAAEVTQPSGPPGGTPTGKPMEIPEGDPANARAAIGENRTAVDLAAAGYQTHQHPSKIDVAAARAATGDTGDPGRDPDLLVEGRVFETYSPEANTSVRNVYDTAREKVEDKQQSQRIVLDLDRWKGDLDALQKNFDDYPIQGVKEVKAITPSGEIIQILPRTDG
jgi:hypothetical protein